MEKSDETRVLEIMKDLEMKEKMYNEMSKETLVNILVMKDLLDEAFEPEGNKMNFWYFVSDWTGAKYITNEQPKKHILYGKTVYMTDGEVNIRVPKCMESLFPEIKYEDEPVKVSITTAYSQLHFQSLRVKNPLNSLIKNYCYYI